MTGTEMLAYVRDLIQETSEAEHTDDMIAVSLNRALRKWSNYIVSNIPSYFIKTDTVTLSASSYTVALPSDCKGTILTVYDATNDRFLDLQATAAMDPEGTGTPTKYDLYHDSLRFNSAPSSDMDFTVFYFFTPTEIAKAGLVEIDFPVDHHELICYEACIDRAVRDHGLDTGEFKSMRNELKEDLNLWLCNRVKGMPSRTGNTLFATIRG